MTRAILASALTLVLTGAAAAQTGTQGQQQTPPPPPPVTQPPPQLPTAPPQPAVPFPADAKIAFVSLPAIVSQSTLGKQGSDAMAKFTKPLDDDLANRQKEIETLTKELEAQASVLSPVALTQKRSAIDQKTRELQYQQNERNAKVQDFNQQLLQGFEAKVLPVIEAIRNEKGLWVIFADDGSQGGLSVVSFNPGLDLTMEVVKRLDAATAGGGQ